MVDSHTCNLKNKRLCCHQASYDLQIQKSNSLNQRNPLDVVMLIFSHGDESKSEDTKNIVQCY